MLRRIPSCYDCSFVNVKRVKSANARDISGKGNSDLAHGNGKKEDRHTEEDAGTCDCDSGGRVYGVRVNVVVGAYEGCLIVREGCVWR